MILLLFSTMYNLFFTFHSLPSTIHHPPSTIDHHPSTIDHLPSTIYHPPFTIYHHTCTTHYHHHYNHHHHYHNQGCGSNTWVGCATLRELFCCLRVNLLGQPSQMATLLLRAACVVGRGLARGASVANELKPGCGSGW